MRRSPSRTIFPSRPRKSARASQPRQSGILSHDDIIDRVEEDLKRNLAFQRGENVKLAQQVSLVKQEKTMLQQSLLALQKRIQELELQIGGE